MLVTRGGQTPGQMAQTGRRLDAGVFRRGGGVREWPLGVQMDGRGPLRDEGTRPRRLVQVEWSETAQNGGGDHSHCGRHSDVERSSVAGLSRSNG